nr:hypothetical protein [Tanacetum cinerariifolium]
GRQRRAISVDGAVRSGGADHGAWRPRRGDPPARRLFPHAGWRLGGDQIGAAARGARQRAVDRVALAVSVRRPAVEDAGDGARGDAPDLDEHAGGHLRQRRSRRDVVMV